MLMRPAVLLLALLPLMACAVNDLADPPVPLGEFGLGLNIAVADNMQMVPISRPATKEEWESAITDAVKDRFGRYEGTRLYNIGISIDGFALAPPGIPVVAAPKSILAITANIWDDAAQKQLNTEGKKFTVLESLSGDTVIGSGLTRTKAQQMDALAFNAVKRVEDWLLENPEWFGMTEDELKAALAARDAQIAASRKAAKAAPPPEVLPEVPPEEAAVLVPAAASGN